MLRKKMKKKQEMGEADEEIMEKLIAKGKRLYGIWMDSIVDGRMAAAALS